MPEDENMVGWSVDDDDDDDDDDNDDDDDDDPLILNIRAKNHTSERTIVPWTVILYSNTDMYQNFQQWNNLIGA